MSLVSVFCTGQALEEAELAAGFGLEQGEEAAEFGIVEEGPEPAGHVVQPAEQIADVFVVVVVLNG